MSKYGPDITPYLDTFYAVKAKATVENEVERTVKNTVSELEKSLTYKKPCVFIYLGVLDFLKIVHCLN